MPAGVRSLMLPPFTDDKVRLISRVFLFASLHNQNELYIWARAFVILIVVLVLGYFYM
jgi:hypothetical protein